MSPLTVLEATGAISTDHGATVSVRTPSRARAGLHLLAFVAWPNATTPPDFEAAGWEVLAFAARDLESSENGYELVVLRRASTSAEPSFYTFAFETELAVGMAAPAAILAIATGVASDAVSPSFGTEDTVAGGPDFTADDAIAVAYSDAAFSMFYAASSDGFEATANAILEVHGSDTTEDDDPVGAALLVVWNMPEAAGPVGARIATLAGGVPCDGKVMQAIVRAAPPAEAPRWDSNDTVAIGLPAVGV